MRGSQGNFQKLRKKAKSRRANMKLIQRAPVVNTTQIHGFRGGLHSLLCPAPPRLSPVWYHPGHQGAWKSVTTTTHWGSLSLPDSNFTEATWQTDPSFNFCISQWLYHLLIMHTVSLALQTSVLPFGVLSPFSLKYKSFFVRVCSRSKLSFHLSENVIPWLLKSYILAEFKILGLAIMFSRALLKTLLHYLLVSTAGFMVEEFPEAHFSFWLLFKITFMPLVVYYTDLPG